jgi:hypothetical protein
MSERWLPVVGYEGLYEVSDMGRVRGVERLVWNKGGRAARWQRVRAVVKSPWMGGPYPIIRLCKDGKKFTVPVHRLVAEAFLGPPPEGHEVCHCEGVAIGDMVSNLYWGTRKQNMEDGVRHGTSRRGVRNPHAKLTPENVEIIRQQRAAGVKLAVIAAQFNVSAGAASLAARRITWGYIP